MTFRAWAPGEDLEAAIDRVDSFTLSVKAHLNEIDGITHIELLDQVGRLRARMDRLTHAVEASAPAGGVED